MMKSFLKLPDSIYKFVSIDTLIGILSNSTLMFTAPKDFNDPYDCYLGLISYETNLAAINRIRDDINIREEEKILMLEDMLKRPAEVSDILKQTMDRLLSNGGVSCFSLQRESLLMWSHYADKHRGACIEFDPNILFSPFANKANINEVRYQSQFKTINFHDARQDAIENLVFTKSSEWSYEMEYRILIDRNGLIDIDLNSVLSITFGAKCTEKDRAKDKASLRNLELKYYESELAKDEFRLQFKALS